MRPQLDPGLLHAPLFQAGVEQDHRAAFMHGSEVLDYATLHTDISAGCGWLTQTGCVPGDRIAIALPKNLLAIRVIFSALAAGTVVVPIDPSAPPARIAHMLADAAPHLLITTRRLAVTLSGTPGEDGPQVVCLDTTEDWNTLVTGKSSPPAGMDPDAPAVFYYTSGTTGSPKAIVLTHANVAGFANWAIAHLGLTSEDRFASHAPLHFDLTTLDLYAAPRLGATSILLDEVMVKFPARVTQILETTQATVWYSVPTALVMLLRHGALQRRVLNSLRLVLFAGEPFPVPKLRELMSTWPGKRFINLYGPTETNVCTYHQVEYPLPADVDALPIGIPCEHVEITLLREDGSPALNGEAGEIVVRGPAVMAGYWNNPALTEATRLNSQTNSYRTGDIGRRDDLGRIHLLGRKDDLVKIRGYRVELLEVSATLNQHPAVQESIALATATEPARLIAAVVLNEATAPPADALLTHCRQWLPVYAVPDEIHILPALPRTSTGKIDKQALKHALT